MKKISPLGWMIFVLLAAGIVSLTVWTSRARIAGSQSVAMSDELPVSDVPTTTSHPRAQIPGAFQNPQTPEEMAAQLAAERGEVVKLVDTGRSKLYEQYQAERVDGRWAVAKEQTLVALKTSPLIDGVNAAPTTIEVHCRTSVCNVIAEFSSKLAADDWASLYPMSVGTEMPNIALQQTMNADGTVRVEIYGLARK